MNFDEGDGNIDFTQLKKEAEEGNCNGK